MSITWRGAVPEGATIQEFTIETIQLTPDLEAPWSAKIVAVVKRQGAAHQEVVHFNWNINSPEMRDLFEAIIHQHAYDEQAHARAHREAT